jgi:SPP1 gp7 family putative phage head morphogenesis protein
VTLTDIRSGVCTGDGPCDIVPIGQGKNWVNRVGGLPLYIRAIAQALLRSGHSESDAVSLAVGTVKRWAAGEGKVTDATRARAAKAVAEWEAKKAQAHGSRDMGPVTEGGSAGTLLPRGPSPKVAQAVEAKMAGQHPDADVPHAFRGADLTKCTICGMAATAAIHGKKRAKTAGKRALATVGQAQAAGRHRERMVHKDRFASDADKLEPVIHQAMVVLFDRQRAGTLSRLRGSRGKRMLAGVRADQRNPPAALPPAPVPPALTTGTPGPVPAVPDAAAIFDTTFWADQTAQALAPIYDDANTLSLERIAQQLGLPSTSIARSVYILRSRENRAAATITDTTFAQIRDTLAEGIEDGDSTAQLTARVQHVFDVARSRAELIARTESIGALNEAAYLYAASLQSGAVASKEWLAHHDERTRPTHRKADGQKVPLHAPFHVGASRMMFPGDPTAPPDEVCNCRCSLLFSAA